jgi:uncharacterized membrane protein (DUF2068 family)
MIEESSKQDTRMNLALSTPILREGAAPTVAQRSAGSRGIFLIAVFDLLKAVLFLVGAAGVFLLVDRSTHVELTRLIHLFRINGDHAFIKNLLVKFNLITNPDKRIFAGVLLLYTMMYAVEGTGLLLRKRWAEYFAVSMTVIPLPFEAYTLLHHATHSRMADLMPADQPLPTLLHNRVFVLKLAVLFINAGIVWFFVYHLRRERKRGGVRIVDQS